MSSKTSSSAPAANEIVPPNDASGRIFVEVKDTAQHETNQAVVAALASAPNLYQRKRKLVRVIAHGSGGAVIQEITRPVLQSIISERIAFFKWAENDAGEQHKIGVAPPGWSVAYVHTAGEWRDVPQIIDVRLRRNGGRLGYDAASDHYYVPTPRI